LVTALLAKNRRIFSIQLPVLPDGDTGTAHVVYRADTPDGVIEKAYDFPFTPGDGMDAHLDSVQEAFETDLVTDGYTLT
jgi:hypothetical protein